ncbi:hypothetical protein K439DRAFT_997077 [Ramaria rubella]|nr:hypothetical protein K439DRAFT_997077 [Ramaria rubella]
MHTHYPITTPYCFTSHLYMPKYISDAPFYQSLLHLIFFLSLFPCLRRSALLVASVQPRSSSSQTPSTMSLSTSSRQKDVVLFLGLDGSHSFPSIPTVIESGAS